MFNLYFRFGSKMTKMTEDAKRQNSRLKQQDIMQFTVTPNQLSKKHREGDSNASKHQPECDDIALSVETKCLEDEARKFDQLKFEADAEPKAVKISEPRTPLKKLLESGVLEELPVKQTTSNDELNYRYVASPVRKRDERKQLPAFNCADCRNFYAGTDLTEVQLQELLQQCSRHRSRNPPPADSPKVCWELDIREDNSQNKTQVGPPLRTRKRYKRRKIADYEEENFHIDDQSEESQIF